jgi:hypothetical protein
LIYLTDMLPKLEDQSCIPTRGTEVPTGPGWLHEIKHDGYPKDRYQTEVESWRNLQSSNIEFTMKRLREPIEG